MTCVEKSEPASRFSHRRGIMHIKRSRSELAERILDGRELTSIKGPTGGAEDLSASAFDHHLSTVLQFAFFRHRPDWDAGKHDCRTVKGMASRHGERLKT